MRQAKHLCAECKQRRATFKRPNGSIAAAKDHPLCRRCFRSFIQHLKALKLHDGTEAEKP